MDFASVFAIIVLLHKPKYASASGQLMAEHSPLGFFFILWRRAKLIVHNSRQIVPVLKQQRSCRPPHYHHHIGVFVDGICLVLDLM